MTTVYNLQGPHNRYDHCVQPVYTRPQNCNMYTYIHKKTKLVFTFRQPSLRPLSASVHYHRLQDRELVFNVQSTMTAISGQSCGVHKVSRFGLVVSGKRKDHGSIPLRLSFLFRKVVVCGQCLVTLSITSY